MRPLSVEPKDNTNLSFTQIIVALFLLIAAIIVVDVIFIDETGLRTLIGCVLGFITGTLIYKLQQKIIYARAWHKWKREKELFEMREDYRRGIEGE